MILPTQQKGMTVVRSILARAAAGRDGNPVTLAAHRHGGGSVVDETRNAVDAGGLASGQWGAVLATPAQQEYLADKVQHSILGKLLPLGLVEVPFNVRIVVVSDSAATHFVGAGKAKPLSKIALIGDTLRPLTVPVIAVITKEQARFIGPIGEARLRTALHNALVAAIDSTLLDPANAGVTDVTPASITYGIVPIASSGNVATDLAALIAAFTGDFASAAFITDPTTAAQITLTRDASGSFAFPDAGPRGGSLLGIPLIVSRASPRDTSGGQLALVDAAGIVYGAEGIRTVIGEHTSLEMVDETTDPPTVEQVSMFQTDSVAILSEISANWKVVKQGSVVMISGASYPTAVA